MAIRIELLNNSGIQRYSQAISLLQESQKITLNTLNESQSLGGFLLNIEDSKIIEWDAVTKFLYLACIDDGRLVGFLRYCSSPYFQQTYKSYLGTASSELEFNIKSAAYISQIAVSKERKRKGIATLLYQEFLRLNPEVRQVFLRIVENPVKNVSSFSFFERLGYKKVGIFEFVYELRESGQTHSVPLTLAVLKLET